MHPIYVRMCGKWVNALPDALRSWASIVRDEAELDGNDAAAFAVPSSVVVLNLIQLLCEGSFDPNKNLLREQQGNSKSVQVLESLAALLNVLSKNCRYRLGLGLGLGLRWITLNPCCCV